MADAPYIRQPFIPSRRDEIVDLVSRNETTCDQAEAEAKKKQITAKALSIKNSKFQIICSSISNFSCDNIRKFVGRAYEAL